MSLFFQTDIANWSGFKRGKFYYINGKKVQSRDGRLQMIAQDLKEAVAERFGFR